MSQHPGMTDPVTGLSNRRHFDLILDFAFNLSTRDTPLTLVLCALEGVDDYAEATARGRDEALSAVGARFASATRGVDLIARFDDSRVACLLVGSNPRGAVVFVHRMREVLHGPGEDTHLDLKGGIAQAAPDMSGAADLVAVAEAALERATRDGQGGVAIAEDDEE